MGTYLVKSHSIFYVFLVIFFNIIIKITTITVIIIIAINIIIIGTFFLSCAQNVVLTSGIARIGGWGGLLIRVMPESKRLFSTDPFP